MDTWTIYTPEGEYAVAADNIHMALGTWEQEHHINAAKASVLAVVNDGMRPPLVIAADDEDAGTLSREEEE